MPWALPWKNWTCREQIDIAVRVNWNCRDTFGPSYFSNKTTRNLFTWTLWKTQITDAYWQNLEQAIINWWYSYRRYCTPKIPEDIRLCQILFLNKIEDEQHFMLNSLPSWKAISPWFCKSQISYNFHSLSANDMILFLFNNLDPFICKKLGHFQGRSQEETTTEANTRSVVRNQPYEIF